MEREDCSIHDWLARIEAVSASETLSNAKIERISQLAEIDDMYAPCASLCTCNTRKIHATHDSRHRRSPPFCLERIGMAKYLFRLSRWENDPVHVRSRPNIDDFLYYCPDIPLSESLSSSSSIRFFSDVLEHLCFQSTVDLEALTPQ
jgi:hypothetical protein